MFTVTTHFECLFFHNISRYPNNPSCMDNRLEMLILQLTDSVEIKRRQLETFCQEYIVLLKPWPRCQKTDGGDGGNKNETRDKKGPPPTSIKEHKELDIVDKLLSQAQKARDVQKRIESKGNKERRNYSRDGVDIKEEGQAKGEGYTAQESGETDSSILAQIRNEVMLEKARSSEALTLKATKKSSLQKTDPSKVNSHVRNAPTERNMVVSKTRNTTQSRVNSNRVNTNTRDSHSGGTLQSRSTQVKPASHSSTASCDKIDSHSSRARDKPVGVAAQRVSRPSSRGKSYSAHVNAPFKTDPTVRVPRSSTTKAEMAHPRLRPNSRPVSARNIPSKQVVDLNNSAKPGDCKSRLPSNGPSNEYHDTAKDNIGSVSDSPKQAASVLDCHKEGRQLDSTDCDDVTEGIVNRVHGLCVSEESERSPGKKEEKSEITEPDVVSTSTEKLFSLLENGRALPVSSKLRRLASANCKLREKVSTFNLTKKVAKTNIRGDFIERLEDQFEPDSDIVVQQRVVSCLGAHHKLLQLLEDLNLDHITELSPVEDVLEVKLKLEYVLAACDALQEETDTLAKASFTAHSNKSVKHTRFPRETTLLQWIPDALLEGCALPRPRFLTYKSGKQLRAFRCQMFELQYVRLQALLAESVRKEFMPLLQTLSHSSSDYLQVYRAVYGFITSPEAQHFPGIVSNCV